MSKDHLFKPGQSGNPSGRPKDSRNKMSVKEVRELFTRENYSPLKELIKLAKADDVDGDIKVKVNTILMQYEVRNPEDEPKDIDAIDVVPSGTPQLEDLRNAAK